MNCKLIMLPNPILVSNLRISVGDSYHTTDYRIVKWLQVLEDASEGMSFERPKPIIAGIEGLPKLDLSAIAEKIGLGGIWALGNKISVTTVYDYEERKKFPNHNEYENFGKQTYIGEVIEVDKGLALKTDDGKVFKTQGTYWFGSILHQDCKLLQAAQSLNEKKYSEEDARQLIKRAILYAARFGEDAINHEEDILRSIKPKEYNVVDYVQEGNTIKVTKIIN